MKLTIGYLYPDLFNLYGDRGNVQCLKKRLQWRGIEAEILEFKSGDRIDFGRLDILVWGGGSDRGQRLAAGQLGRIRQDFRAYVEDGGVVLAVCAAYQLLGKYYRIEGKTIRGLGILDIYTEWNPERLVGDIVVQSTLFRSSIVGFENHAGRTYIGDYTPLGRVLHGRGNTGTDGCEGLVYRNVVATYLHGPLLPKNPEVGDYLLERALSRKYGPGVALSELPDTQEIRANRHIADRIVGKRREASSAEQAEAR